MGAFGTNVSMRVGSGISGMGDARSPAGEMNTTGNARIPRWDMEHHRSSHNSGRTPHRLPAFPDTTPPEASQGQALRAPQAALTPPRLRGQTFHQEGDAGNYAAEFRIT